jgi:hypothetical protein
MKDLAISELRSLWRHFNQQAQPVHTNKDGQAFERTQSQIDFAVNMREKVQRLAGIVNSL